MAEIYRYINTASTPGGNGTTNATTGENRAYVDMFDLEAEQLDLVTAGDNLVVYAEGVAEDTQYVTFSGWGLDATHDIKIIGNANAGVWDASKYRISTSLATPPIYVLDDFITFSFLQISQDTNDPAIRFAASGTSPVFGIDHCIIRGDDSESGYSNYLVYSDNGASQATLNFYNNIIYGYGANGFAHGMYVRDTYLVAYNNTFVDLLGYGIRFSTNGQGLLINNIIFNVVDSILGAEESASDYNAFDEGTPVGSNSIDISGEAGTDIFNDYNNQDFTLKDGSATTTDVVDAGVDLSSDGTLAFSDDITGTTRTGTWDIGAFEYAVTGGINESISVTVDAGITLTAAVKAAIEAIVDTGVALTSSLGSPIGVSAETEAGGSGTIKSPADVTAEPGVNLGLTVTVPISVTAEAEIEISLVGGIFESISVSVEPRAELTGKVSSPVGVQVEPGIYANGELTGPCSVSVDAEANGVATITVPLSATVEAEISISLEGGIAESISVTLVPSVTAGASISSSGEVSAEPGAELTGSVLSSIDISLEGLVDAVGGIQAPVDVSLEPSVNLGLTVIVPISVTGDAEVDIRYQSAYVVTEILSIISNITQLVAEDSPITHVVAGRSTITTLIEEESLI